MIPLEDIHNKILWNDKHWFPVIQKYIENAVPENGVCVEIGSFYGGTTIAFANLIPKSAHLYTLQPDVDEELTLNRPWIKEMYDYNPNGLKKYIGDYDIRLLEENISNIKNVTLIKESSPPIQWKPPENIDFIYCSITSNLDKNIEQFLYWFDYLKPETGLFAIADGSIRRNNHDSVADYVLKNHINYVRTVIHDEGLTVIKKREEPKFWE